MTDINLQAALVEKVKEILKGFTLANNNSIPADVNVYPQELPSKQSKSDDKHFPYVLVCLDEEEIKGPEEGTVGVYFVIGIKDDNPNKQGHMDVANIMNKIVFAFMEERVINMKYRLDFPIQKKFQEQPSHPYYVGGISTFWQLPQPNQRETEYD